MGWGEKMLNILSDPNVAYILFLLGLYGLIFELYSPGAIFPGVIGGICIILALYTMHTLPVNYAGACTYVFGVILFLLEIKIVESWIAGYWRRYIPASRLHDAYTNRWNMGRGQSFMDGDHNGCIGKFTFLSVYYRYGIEGATRKTSNRSSRL